MHPYLSTSNYQFLEPSVKFQSSVRFTMAFCLSNGKDERDRKVKSLQEIINCSRGEADRLLTESDGNLSLACDKFFLANGTDIGGDKAKVRNDFNMKNRNSVINHEKNFTSRLNEHRLLRSGDDQQTTNRLVKA